MTGSDEVRLIDEPDSAQRELAARVWRAAEEARIGGEPRTGYLDAQEQGFVETMERSDAWLTVAVANELVVGCVGGFAAGASRATAYLAYIAVDASLRRRGIGGALMSHAEARARRAGAERIELTVHADNAVPRKLYERAGWELTGRTERTPADDELLVEYARDL